MNREKSLKGIDKAMFELEVAYEKSKKALLDIRNIVFNAESKEKVYNKGLEDAIKLARKLYEMPVCELEQIFDGHSHMTDVLDNYDYIEILAKLEAYEKEQEEIKAGDYCVDEDGLKWLVTYVNKGELPNDIDYHCIDNKGYTSPVLYHKGELKKTGKHIDISSILEQIGGGE